MTELETMQRAKMYMDLLARGMDPITGGPLPAGCGLDQARLGRCFGYVAGVLEKVIANGGVVSVPRSLPFALTPAQRQMVQIFEEPVTVSEWVNHLYHVAENPGMKKLAATAVTDWLMSRGMMAKQTDANGRAQRLPTEHGRSLGISTRTRQNRDGEYQAVYYDRNAQRFLLDNLDAIIARSEKKE